jgi:hypothetical protein
MVLGLELSGIANQAISKLGSEFRKVALRVAPHWLAARVLGLITPALLIEPVTGVMVLVALAQVVPSVRRRRQVSVGLLVEMVEV